MLTNRFNSGIAAIAGGLVLLVPAIAQASGYAVNEVSASASGMANAGAAANAENASVLLFNPAGMGRLDGTQVSGGVALIDVDTDFNGKAYNFQNEEVSGGDGGDMVDLSVIPNFAVSHRLNEYSSVGLGLSVPFGVVAEYEDDFKGRFFADETDVQMINIQPTLSLNNDEGFSIGVGLNIIYAEGLISKAQGYEQQLQPLGGFLGAGRTPETWPEGHSEAEGDDWGVGVIFGMMLQPYERTTLGLTYRSSIDLDLEGEANSISTPVPTASGIVPVTLTEDVVVPLDTPESLTLSVAQGLNDEWTLYASVAWTKWSRFEDLDIVSDEENGPISEIAGTDVISHTTEEWEDTWSFAIGTKWQATDAWAFKAGYAFDQSPVQDKYRTVRVPGADRNWLTLGAQWKSRNDLSVDLALGYLIIEDVDVEEYDYDIDDQILDPNKRVVGEYELDAWGAGLQVSKVF